MSKNDLSEVLRKNSPSLPAVEMLHLDVMDGQFVPNISFGPGVIAAPHPHSKLFFDIHLMIEAPGHYLDVFAKAGADAITVHYESTKDPAAVLQASAPCVLQTSGVCRPRALI